MQKKPCRHPAMTDYAAFPALFFSDFSWYSDNKIVIQETMIYGKR